MSRPRSRSPSPITDVLAVAALSQSRSAITDALAVAAPSQFSIGTANAFRYGHAFPYAKSTIGGEDIYVCTKGSEWARAGEFLVLRCNAGTWTAWDSVIEDGTTLRCRQPVFRCAEDITTAGWHTWSTNFNASSTGDGSAVAWRGSLPAETRHA